MEREENRAAMIEQTQLNNGAINRVVRPSRPRTFAGPELKLLIAAAAVVSTLAFWSLFSNRDRMLAIASQANESQANTQVVLAPVPTALPQQLRFVTAPGPSAASAPAVVSNTSKAPARVTIKRPRVAPVTTTRSSKP